MERFFEYVRLFLQYLWIENGGAVIATGIATLLMLIACTDWAKQNKGFVLFVWFMQIVLNIPCAFFSDAEWYTRLYAGGLIVFGVVEFYQAMKIKTPKKTVLDLSDLGMPGQTVVFDNKEMFEQARAGAARGEPMYICNMGLFYMNGTGTRVDLNKSREYFEILSRYPDAFWREEGRRNLATVNRMIEERNRKLREAAKDGAADITKDFFGID